MLERERERVCVCVFAFANPSVLINNRPVAQPVAIEPLPAPQQPTPEQWIEMVRVVRRRELTPDQTLLPLYSLFSVVKQLLINVFC